MKNDQLQLQIDWPHKGIHKFEVGALLQSHSKEELLIVGYDHCMKRNCAIGLLESNSSEEDKEFFCYAIKQSEATIYTDIILKDIGESDIFLNSKFGRGWESEEFTKIKIPDRIRFWLEDRPLNVVYKVKQGTYYCYGFWDMYPDSPVELDISTPKVNN